MPRHAQQIAPPKAVGAAPRAARKLWLLAFLVLTAPIAVMVFAKAGSSPTETLHDAFVAENRTVMDKMMAGMALAPTGDVDRDFAAMMIPHHQGAIDMAVLEIRYGRNEQLRRIAQEIIVTQQQEIAAMRLALGQPLPPPVAAPTQSDPTARPSVPSVEMPHYHRP
jgi:Domain of unknown function (DUF305)